MRIARSRVCQSHRSFLLARYRRIRKKVIEQRSPGRPRCAVAALRKATAVLFGDCSCQVRLSFAVLSYSTARPPRIRPGFTNLLINPLWSLEADGSWLVGVLRGRGGSGREHETSRHVEHVCPLQCQVQTGLFRRSAKAEVGEVVGVLMR